MNRTLFSAAAIAATMAFSAPAFASSMPKADISRNTLGLGVGNGVSFSLDFPLSRQLSLGGALSANGFVNGGTLTNTVDLRLLYMFVSGGSQRPWVDLLAGVQIYGARFGAFTFFDPFIGVALAYPFTSKLTGRLNLAAAFNTSGGAFNGTRASGIELGYEFTPNLEGTIGANGRGDIIGLKFSF